MLKIPQILVTAHVLVGAAAMLTACGQKGPLVLPSAPESAGRATLPQSLRPWRAQPAPASPAAKPDDKTPAPATAEAPPKTTTAPLPEPQPPADTTPR